MCKAPALKSTLSLKLPVELICLIIEAVQDTPTLLSLTLTCRGLLSHSQRHLYSSFKKRSTSAICCFINTVATNPTKASYVHRLDFDVDPDPQNTNWPAVASFVEEFPTALKNMTNLTSLYFNFTGVHNFLVASPTYTQCNKQVLEIMASCDFKLKNFCLDNAKNDYIALYPYLITQPDLERLSLYTSPLALPSYPGMSFSQLRLLKASTSKLMDILPLTRQLEILVWRVAPCGLDINLRLLTQDTRPSKEKIESISEELSRIRYLSYGNQCVYLEWPSGASGMYSGFSLIAGHLKNLECLELFHFNVEKDMHELKNLTSPHLRMLLVHSIPNQRPQSSQASNDGPRGPAIQIMSQYPHIRFVAEAEYNFDTDLWLCNGTASMTGVYRVYDSKSSRPDEPTIHNIPNSELMHHHIFELLPQ
ncbi:hypothetical protein CPC08DRAFT_803708 [Agrocybe pediades]|nr:hypothetical protein CPC08DRAFT_803708 [Agrocybe pediades]